MRLVEERSLSSILRSNLLTTLINNDVSGKVNASGWARALDKFDVMQMCFRVQIGGPRPCLRNFVDEKSDFLSAERCPVTVRPNGTAGNWRASEGTGRNRTIFIKRGRSSAG
jgi:hypothetical protein